MVNNQELLYVVDEFDTPLAPMTRKEVMEQGHWRRTAHVWIINSKNEVLCQRRSMKKDMAPGKWEASVAGHLSPEDNYFTGAAREVNEETGLPIKAQHLELIKIYKDHEFREYRGIFLCKWDAEKHEIISEEDEVSAVKFVKISTLKKYLSGKDNTNWVKPSYVKDVFSVLN